MVTNADIGWAAGIIDGEGCISAYGYAKKKSTGKNWCFSVAVANTDIRILHRLKELWGGKIIKMSAQPLENRPCWRWYLYSQKACEFLQVLRPYLVSKGEQADLALEFGKLIGEMGQKVGEENHRQRENIALQLKIAKGRKVG